MCATVVQLPARKAFSLWLCPGLDCPRGLENLHNWRLLTKSRQMSLRSQAGTADPASHWQLYPPALRGAAAPGQPVQASGLSGKWKDTCSGGAICTEHPWLLYSCSFSSCSSLGFHLLPLVPGAAGTCPLLRLHTRLTSSPGQLCPPGAFSGEKQPGGEAGMLQTGRQQSWTQEELVVGAECLGQDTIPFPGSSRGCCSMGCMSRVLFLGEGEPSGRRISQWSYWKTILYSTASTLVRSISNSHWVSLLCPVQGWAWYSV